MTKRSLRTILYVAIASLLPGFLGWTQGSWGGKDTPLPVKEAREEDLPGRYSGKKVLWVDSYHPGYEWSDGVHKGILDVLDKTGVDLRIFRMDTKNNDSVGFGEEAGFKARAVVEEYKPDVVIATDDNAQKYLVVPYLRDSDLPVVFAGVNMDASMYGYPCGNVTGMIEVDLVEEMLRHMKQYASGDRVGYLGGNTQTERKQSRIWNEKFLDGKMKTYLAEDFQGFKDQFLRAQQEVDMLFLVNYAGIRDWDPIAAEKFLAGNTRVPTAAPLQYMDRFVVFVLGKYPEEQGEYAAQTALKILGGAKPSDFPLTANRGAKLTVNLKMAQAAGIVLPVSVLKIAHVLGKEAHAEGNAVPEVSEPGRYRGKRILWVDSYHGEYPWSEGIGRGIRQVLVDSGVELHTLHMDTKRHDSIEFGKEAGRRARAAVEEFKPDVVIATDDNAQKYLVVPYLKDTDLPVVFSGVNWDASMYGYPCKNVTGMVEVDPMDEMMNLFKGHAKGGRIGYLSGDVETERKIVDYYNKTFFNGWMKVYLVKTFQDFQREFLRAQSETDMLFFFNYTGIEPWDPVAAEEFLARNTRIPTGSPNPFMAPFVMFVAAKLPEEQGSYAAQTALKILDGTPPADIPVTVNKQSKVTVNLKMAKAAGMVLPISTLRNVVVIGQEALDRK